MYGVGSPRLTNKEAGILVIFAEEAFWRASTTTLTSSCPTKHETVP